MSFNVVKILESKRRFRQGLAARPIAEKLAMLDELRERALAIRAAKPVPESRVLHEDSPPYRAQRKKGPR
jgi:hypothetical protein